MRVFALFDDPHAIQEVRDALEKEGRGDEVVRIVTPERKDPSPGTGGETDDSQPQRVAPVMGGGQSISGPAVVNQTGRTSPRTIVDNALDSLGSYNLPHGEREAFAQAMRHQHAQILILDVDEDQAKATEEMLREGGAQLVAST